MKRKNLFFLIALLCAACSDQIEQGLVQTQQEEASSVSKDKLSAKLNPEIVARINNRQTYLSVPTGDDQLDAYLKQMGATRISRIFPYAGKDEGKQVESGLNLWYTIWLDIPQSRGGKTRLPIDIAKDKGINDIASYAEPVYIPKIENATYAAVGDQTMSRTNEATTSFNDPLYPRQWDFKNNGTVGKMTAEDGSVSYSSIAGADINIEPAWKYTTGDPDVVVAVVDGGIATTHPDLQASMWINEGEIPNNGIDDDNNGFVDDYYGYNFCDDNGQIIPTRHGTHVAGTIAARNNNGIGVCGIAGGNGNSNTGVRIMSCQIFKPNPNYDPNDPESSETIGTGDRNLDAAAIVYGANNGAVISQNSWGFTTSYKETPKVIHEAIEYFNKNAGGNKTKKPLMQGGIVIFAAGNDGSGKPSYPASDEDVVSVSAFNPDYQASWYTNYGETVDIAAPGGTQPVKGRYPTENGLSTSAVLSTVPLNADGRGGYAYMQGTSMACPHVSGIAALIVSQYGKAGFTSEQLRTKLLSGIKSFAYNDYVSSIYDDKMGVGYVDAFVVLQDFNDAKVPLAPVFLSDKTKAGYGELSIAWQSDNQGNDGSLLYYVVYYSQQPITEANYKQAQSLRIQANYATKEEVFERTFSGLKANTTYYFAIQAVSRSGVDSPIAILNTGLSTLNDEPPHIEPLFVGNRVVMAGKDVRTLQFRLSDPENHRMTVRLANAGAMEISNEGDIISLTIRAEKYIPGIYPFQLVVADEYGAQSIAQIILEIVADNPPALADNINVLSVKKGSQQAFKLSDIIKDEQPDKLESKVVGGDKTTATIANDRLIIYGKEWGEDKLTLTVTDAHHQTATFKVPVFVYDNEGIYALYPTRTTSTLYLRVGENIVGDYTIVIKNVAGKEVFNQTYNTRNLDSKKYTLLLNVDSISPDYYVLFLKHKGKIYQSKFIKE